MAPKIGYLEIPARDQQRAAEFFSSVFGWQPRRHQWSGGVHVILEGAAAGVGCALAEAAAASFDAPMPVVHVEGSELMLYLKRVVSAGGEVVEEPRSIDELGSFARFRDSEGNMWGLWAAVECASQS